MAKRDEFRLDITANDQASGKIDEVAGKLEGLNAAATVSIDAEDNASEVIDEVTQEVEELDGETAEAELTADDEASEVVGDVTEAVEGLDEASAETTLSADDQASAEISTVVDALGEVTDVSATITVDDTGAAGVGDIASDLQAIDSDTAFSATITVDDDDAAGVGDIASALESIDSDEAFSATVTVDDTDAANVDDIAADLQAIDSDEAFEATVTVDDTGAAGVDDIAADLETIGGDTFSGDVDVDTSGAAGVDGVADDMAVIAAGATASIALDGAEGAKTDTGVVAGNLKTGAAAAAGIITGLLAVGLTATDQILDVESLATAIGGSLEQTSALKEAWELAGGNVDTLERNVIRANDRMRESPQLAAALGITISDNMTPLDVFVATVEALNSGQLSVNERLSLATDIFGSKGVIMLDDLQTRVGDLSTAMDGVSENEIITQSDVDAAHEMLENWDDIQDAVGNLEREALPAISSLVSSIATLLGTWPVEKLIGGFEVLGTNISLIQAGINPMLVGASDEVGNLAEEFSILNDEMHDTLGAFESDDITKQVDAWKTLRQAIADGTVETDEAQDAIEELSDATGIGEEDILALATAHLEGVAATDAATEANLAEAEAQQAAADAAADHQQAIDDEIASLEDQKDALKDATDALDDKIDAERRSVDAFYAEESAAKKAQEAEDDYYATNEDGTFVIEDRDEALSNVVETNDRYAQSVVELARQEAAANGTTFTRTQAIDLENRTLMAQATNLSGPLRDAVLAHILRINSIPEFRITDILTDTNPNNLAQTQDEIDSVANKRRVAAVIADANDASVAEVMRQLNLLANPRTVYFAASGPGTRGGGRLAPRAVATGDPFTSEGLYLAGEYGGPELIELGAGARVHNSTQTAEILDDWAGGGGGNTYITTLNVPSGTTAREALKATRRYGRIQAA